MIFSKDRHSSRHYFRNIALTVLTVCSASMSFAVTTTHPSSTTMTDDSWHFDVVPYLWALNMNGHIQVGRLRGHVNETFNDILRQMTWGGMLYVDAYKGKWGVYLNALYAALYNHANDGPFSIGATNDFGIFGAGVSYEAYKTCFSQGCGAGHSFSVSPYAGFRYTLNNTTVKVGVPALRVNLRKSDNQNWTDPLIGVKLDYLFAKAWSLIFFGDVGGTNTVSHYSYNVTGLLGYHPQTMMTSTTWYLGYRWLDQHYETGRGQNYFNWNMKLFGPLAGVSFSF